MKTALVGYGYWGSKLKKYIMENPFFELTHVCDSKTDLNQVWPEVKAAVVATPNHTHYGIVKEALNNGIHILCEKPLALETRECAELRKLAVDLGLKLHVEYTYTFSKGVKQALEWVESRNIGELLSVEMMVRHLGRFKGGSVYWLLGSHMLSVLDMFAPLEVLEYSKKDLVVVDGEVETGRIDFEGEITGHIIVSLNYMGKETKIVWYGEKGTVIFDPLSKEWTTLRLATYERIPWIVMDKLPVNEYPIWMDESNNLRYAIESFQNVLTGKEKSNVDTAVEVTNILENL